MQIDEDHPYADVGDRLRWHRKHVVDMNQVDYAASIGVKRARYGHWESGYQRITIESALVLRTKYGLSLDFIYAGIADALPMTVRNAWLSRP